MNDDFGRAPSVTFDSQLEAACPKCTYSKLGDSAGETHVLHPNDHCSYCKDKRVVLTDKGGDMLVFLSRWYKC